MNEITVWLPFVGNLRLDEPPENLEFYVMKSFHDFTEGTAKVYEFEDKLHYLDNLRKVCTQGALTSMSEGLYASVWSTEWKKKAISRTERTFYALNLWSTVSMKGSCRFTTPIILEAKAETRSVCGLFCGLSARL